MTIPTSTSACETHLSRLFFTPDRVFKQLKPVTLPFVDFSDAEERCRAATHEYERNQAISPDVYLGLADVVENGDVVDRLIVMRRLREQDELTKLLNQGNDSALIFLAARLVAGLHAGLTPLSGAHAEPASLESIAQNWQDNFDTITAHVGAVIDQDDFTEVQQLAQSYIAGRRSLFEERRWYQGLVTTDFAIRTAGLTKDFGGHLALDGLDLEVPVGQVYGFLGPNGAGKSTTIRILLDFIRPSNGSASVLGLDPRADAVALRSRLGFLPGDFLVDGRQTGNQLLTYLAGLRGGVPASRIASLVERLDLDPTRRIDTLSRGNRQKVGLIQAVMHEPELLILDEPTSGLDPFLQHEFAQLMREAADEGRTAFVSSHVMGEVQQMADTVAIIRDGRIVTVERVEELRRHALHNVTIEFEEPVPLDEFAAVHGVIDASVEGSVLRCRLDGAADGLIKAAARYTVRRDPGAGSGASDQPDQAGAAALWSARRQCDVHVCVLPARHVGVAQSRPADRDFDGRLRSHARAPGSVHHLLRCRGLGLGQDQPDHRSRRGPSTVELHEGELRVERWLGLRGMTVDVRTSVRRRRIRHPSGSAQRVFLTGSWWAEVSPAPELSNQGESNPVDERR
ncbi:Daunorubicin/doxorubicin resistance ATP-binding protein DrrA [Nymphon striatum]|nr:Daunorubicin/doxorubicin resistance ATP-binding protein DrrA [Nymphon striatum]